MNAPKIALTGPVQLELLAPYFRARGYELAAPGEIPDLTYDVTAHADDLEREVPGFYDSRLEKLAGCPYSLSGIRAIVDEFAWAQASRFAKVLAVDADNTLWKGILSEDGAGALVAYEVFQAGLWDLRDAGVLLVLTSKNDPDSIALGGFTLKKVNWSPKAGNLIEACRELNVGVDSVVFLDDNAHERAQMQAHLPEVVVAPWTGWQRGDEAEQRQLLRRLSTYFFAGMGTTNEDRLRAAEYARRLAARTQARPTNVEDYLKDLALWVKPSRAAEADLDRLAQMAAKTNQFNATTLRRTREELAHLLADTYVFRAGDRFGEQGIVCYVIVDRAARRITDFVMSCRAMGRTLERFAYAYVTRELGCAIEIDFTPTAKNAPFAAFRDTLPSPGPTYYRELQS